MNVFLAEKEKKILLKVARNKLESILGISKEMDIIPEGRLAEKYGMFVTLKKNGNLRGCIGYIEGVKNLIEEVRELVISSAFNDSRFYPLQKEELPYITIEISVLTPFKRILPEEVVVGRHGLMIQKGFFRGLLLPQVALEWGFDREVFLDAVCQKAGLPSGCWMDSKCELYAFEAIVFSEEDFKDD